MRERLVRERISVLERFIKHLAKEPHGKCWVWVGASMKRGYGVMMVKPGSPSGAHQVAWELAYGPIPRDKFVLHDCDNPRCIRPSHLWLGTAQDNSDDMVKKGRQVVGEKVVGHKLKVSEVLEIRRLFAKGWRRQALSKKFSVSPGMIFLIVTRRSWKHI